MRENAVVPKMRRETADANYDGEGESRVKIELDRRFNYAYTYNPSYFGSRSHTYELTGREGAIHFHVTEFKPGEWSGSLEEHRRVAPDGVDRPPSQLNCRLLGGPCWHDGTSLYASEVLIPRWHTNFPNHDAVFQWMAREFDDRFRRVS